MQYVTFFILLVLEVGHSNITNSLTLYQALSALETILDCSRKM